jgi:hypothetical protein
MTERTKRQRKYGMKSIDGVLAISSLEYPTCGHVFGSNTLKLDSLGDFALFGGGGGRFANTESICA